MVSLKYAVLNASIIVYITAASVYKSRLCVEYEIANYWAKEEALLVIHGLTRGGCMVQCVHQPICRAFNFRPSMSNFLQGSIFARLVGVVACSW